MVVCSGVLFLLYRLVLEQKTGYLFCRVYLLVSLVISAVIPALRFKVWPGETIEIPVTLLSMPQAAPAAAGEAVRQGHVVPWLLAIYGTVSLFFIISIAFQFCRIGRYRRQARKSYEGKPAIYEGAHIATPFTFFNSIFIPAGLAPEEREQVVAHEMSHARHRHSVELLAMELLKAVMWYDPFLWLIRRALAEVHEYEADNAVLERGHDVFNYKNLLLRQLLGYSPDISNGLACAKTKKRFIMMDRKKPGRLSLLRAAAAVPVLGALIAVFSCTNKDPLITFTDGPAQVTAGSPTPAAEYPIMEILATANFEYRVLNTYVEEETWPTEAHIYFDGEPTGFTDLSRIERDDINSVTVVAQRRLLESYGIDDGKALILVESKGYTARTRDEGVQSERASAAGIPEPVLLMVGEGPEHNAASTIPEPVVHRFPDAPGEEAGAGSIPEPVLITYEPVRTAQQAPTVTAPSEPIRITVSNGGSVPEDFGREYIEKFREEYGMAPAEYYTKQWTEEFVREHGMTPAEYYTKQWTDQFVQEHGVTPAEYYSKQWSEQFIREHGMTPIEYGNAQAARYREEKGTSWEEVMRNGISSPVAPGEANGQSWGIVGETHPNVVEEAHAKTPNQTAVSIREPVIITNGTVSGAKIAVYINGEESDLDIGKLDYNVIESIEVRKDDATLERYGKAGYDGILFITTKEP